MLEGLEAVEMRLSEVNADNKSARIDSQFHTKKNVKNPNFKYVKVGSILKKSQYGISISMNENDIGYPIYRMNEIHDMTCDSNVKKSAVISEKQLQEFQLDDRDVLFNRTNSFKFVGRTGIYKSNNSDKPYVFASYLVRFVPNEIYVLPEYLTVFLNCESTILQIKSRARQSINQSNVNPEEIKDIEIPLLSLVFQQVIKSYFDQSYKKQIESTQLYSEAEQLLLQELDLADFEPSTENIAIKKLGESFRATGRLDAEYYQPKYEEIENVISKYTLGYDSIVSLFKLSKQTFKVDMDKLYEYVEIGSIDVSSGEIMPEFIRGLELPANAKRKLKTGQVIVSKVRTYRSGIAIVDKNDYVGSGAFSVLEENPNSKINKETLFIFLRSNLFLEWSLKPNTGTSYPVILDEDILNFNIPLIDQNAQNIIATKIQESFTLRKESKRLLNIAKQAVEMAIEQNEEIATGWLNDAIIPEININEIS